MTQNIKIESFIHKIMNKNRFILVTLFVTSCFLCLAGNQPDNKMLKYIQNKSNIREGGSNLYNYEGNIYIVSVVSLAVGTKSEKDCKSVGSTKAKREMLSFINGSDITSYTELRITETAVETTEGQKETFQQDYIEYIRETVMGTINQCVPLGSWYSEDRSVYYFAIYKIVE